MNKGQLNLYNNMATCIRYQDAMEDTQLLVVWFPQYIPRRGESVTIVDHEQGWDKRGVVTQVSSTYNVKANVNEITIELYAVIDLD